MKIPNKKAQGKTVLSLSGVTNPHGVKTRILSVCVFTASLFVSCSGDDETMPVNDGQVKFTSGVSALQTRVSGAGGDEWELNDPIGIYMVESGSTKVAENASNVQYKAQSAGITTNFISATPIYYPTDETKKVAFIIYHPYSSSVNGYLYHVNVVNQTHPSAIDLMTAMADNGGAGYNKNHPSVIDLTFNHQLVKMVLNVTAGAGIDNLTGLTVSIKGMNTTAGFDIASGTLNNQGGMADITPYSAANNTYEAILLPVTALSAAHIVEFTTGGNTYTWTMSNNTGNISSLAAGNKYTFNIELHKYTMQASGTINVWGNGGESNGIAE